MCTFLLSLPTDYPSACLQVIVTFDHADNFRLELNVLQQVEVVCIHAEILENFGVVKIIWEIIGWRKVAKGDHLLTALSDS